MEEATSSDEEDESLKLDFTKKTWRHDVAFVVQGQRLYASKCVLAMVSPVFECMFGTQFAEKDQKEVDLPGKKFEDFHEFLKCIYPAAPKSVSQNNVNQLLPLADEYQVKPLLKKCKKFLYGYLVKNEAATGYLLQCYDVATRFNLQDIKELSVNLLSERNPEDISVSKGELQEASIFIQAQTDVMKRQSQDRDDVRTELVRLYMNMDTTRNMFCPDIPGFENARGAVIQFWPSLSTILRKDIQLSPPVRIWDVFFQVQVSHYIKTDGEQCMKFKMRCKFPEDGLSRKCEVKSKISIKNLLEGPHIIHISHTLNSCIYTSEKPYSSYVQNLNNVFRNESVYVKKDRIQVVIHLMANKPEVQGPKGPSSPSVSDN